MYHRNDGSIKDDAVQNQFTTYLKEAIHNKRIDYLYKQKPNLDSLTDNIEYLADESEDLIAMYAECDLLKRALQGIKERERYILSYIEKVIQNIGGRKRWTLKNC